jgi:hypothetical protein
MLGDAHDLVRSGFCLSEIDVFDIGEETRADAGRASHGRLFIAAIARAVNTDLAGRDFGGIDNPLVETAILLHIGGENTRNGELR